MDKPRVPQSGKAPVSGAEVPEGRRKTSGKKAGKKTAGSDVRGGPENVSLPRPRMSREWPVFSGRLAQVLAELPDEYCLLLALKRTAHCIRFAARGHYGLRIEMTSNAFLPSGQQFDASQLARLTELGWFAPTGTPDEATPELDPDGSPNHYIEFAVPVDFASVARFVTATLLDVLKISHPHRLDYEAFDGEGASVFVLGLGLARHPAESEAGLPKPEKQDLRSVVREVTGIAALDYDQDGDLVVRYGELPIIITPHEASGTVSLFSPLVDDLEETPSLMTKLNTVNTGLGPLHLFLHENTLCARCVLPADPLVTSHLSRMLRQFGEIVEAQQAAFSHEFSGEAFVAGKGGSKFTH